MENLPEFFFWGGEVGSLNFLSSFYNPFITHKTQKEINKNIQLEKSMIPYNQDVDGISYDVQKVVAFGSVMGVILQERKF